MKQDIPPRRVVLRGALAVGCSLLMPVALFGCDSKKGTQSGGSAPAGSPATSANPGPANSAPASSPATSANPSVPAATKKAPQSAVQYQPQPKGEQNCAGCLHFIAESNTCKLVEGQISPEGWCSLWAKKA